MGALDQHLTCPECQKSLSIKVRQIVLEWSETKVSFHNGSYGLQMDANITFQYYSGHDLNLAAEEESPRPFWFGQSGPLGPSFRKGKGYHP